MSDLPPCVICNPKLDLELHEIALCIDHMKEAPVEERLIHRNPVILDEWIQEKRREARASI